MSVEKTKNLDSEGTGTRELLSGLKNQLERINKIDEYSNNQKNDAFKKYKEQYDEAIREGTIFTTKELKKFSIELHRFEDNLEYSKGIDMNDSGKISELRISKKELSSMNNREFLKIPESERLQYVTLNHIDVEKIIFGEINNIEFNFDQDGDGKDNKELFRLTTAGQVLPDMVRTVESDGINYYRAGLNGEFFSDNGVRLKIYTGTNIEIGAMGTSNELQDIKDNNSQKVNEFVVEFTEYGSNEYDDIIKSCVDKGLEKSEIEFILGGDFSKIDGMDKNKAEKLLVSIRFLDNSGLLDDFSNAGEVLDNIKELKEFLDKYCTGIKYNVDNSGKVIFEGNGDIPENVDKEASLKKMIHIATSQLGVNEYNGSADKFVGGKSSQAIPWCAGYVSWVLEQSGYVSLSGANKYRAKAFIGESGYGHVGIKLGNKIIGGNQDNKVSVILINRPIIGWVMPENVGDISKTNKNGPYNYSDIPDGAIIVHDRKAKNKQYS